MTPSEYQELAEFVAAAFDRQREEMQRTLEAFRVDVTAECRRIAEVSVEELRSEIRTVAEAVTVNRGLIEENARGIERNGRRIDDNGRRIVANGERIDANGRRIDANGKRIDALSERFDQLEARVEAHEVRLGHTD